MAFHYSPNIVTNGLKICIDPANNKSYPGTGFDVYDLSPELGITYSIVDQVGWNTSNSGSFIFFTPEVNIVATASRISSNTNLSFQNLNTEMTIDVWFKRTISNNQYNMLLSTGLPYLSFLDTNQFLFSFDATGQKWLYSVKTYLDNVWYNVCCTLTQTAGTSVAKIYVNGILESTSPTYTGVTISNYVWPFSLGNHSVSRYPFVGNISCFKLYNRILTDSEILNNFNALKGRFGL